jgi:hypothetical protein
MQSQSHETRIGTFRIGKVAATGHVAIDGKKTSVRLSSKKLYHFGKKEEARIRGTLTDHEKITLIDCVAPTVPGSTKTSNGQSYHSSVFPHYIVTGSQHIEPDKKSVGAIELLIENADVLFWDHTAFGSSLGNREANRAIIAQLTSGNGEPTEIGEHPAVLYFTGKSQILAAETSLGRIVVSHCPTFESPSASGLRVENSIPIRIEFEKPQTFHASFDRAWALLAFVDLVMGTKHRIKGYSIKLAKKGTTLDVYQTMAPHRGHKKKIERPHPSDVLINGGIQPDAFSAVLKAWLTRQAEWRPARFRFIQNLRKQHSYTVRSPRSCGKSLRHSPGKRRGWPTKDFGGTCASHCPSKNALPKTSSESGTGECPWCAGASKRTEPENENHAPGKVHH